MASDKREYLLRDIVVDGVDHQWRTRFEFRDIGTVRSDDGQVHIQASKKRSHGMHVACAGHSEAQPLQ